MWRAVVVVLVCNLIFAWGSTTSQDCSCNKCAPCNIANPRTCSYDEMLTGCDLNKHCVWCGRNGFPTGTWDFACYDRGQMSCEFMEAQLVCEVMFNCTNDATNSVSTHTSTSATSHATATTSTGKVTTTTTTSKATTSPAAATGQTTGDASDIAVYQSLLFAALLVHLLVQ